METKIMPYTLTILLLLTTGINGCAQDKQPTSPKYKVSLTEEEWRKKLTPEEYYILREQGTERAFTGIYWDHKEPGKYHCKGCDTPLFDSKTKYKSGTGWPSFYEGLEPNIATSTDYDIGYARTEIHCAACGGHLGHVFKDGPEPTGLRYCVNSASLSFNEE